MKIPDWHQLAEAYTALMLFSAIGNWGDKEQEHVIEVERLRKLAAFCRSRI